MGVFVLLTSSNNEQHFALNSEIATSRIFFVLPGISAPFYQRRKRAFNSNPLVAAADRWQSQGVTTT
jgi:hypothetical protein